jgi:hypothetical protein
LSAEVEAPPTVDRTVALLMGRIDVLEQLVRWLSLPLGDNEPIFAGATGEGTLNGLPLGAAPQLHALWHQVTDRDHDAEGESLARTWAKCETCGMWSVTSGT